MEKSIYKKRFAEEEKIILKKMAALIYYMNYSQALQREIFNTKYDPALQPTGKARQRYEQAVSRQISSQYWKQRGKRFQKVYQRVSACVASLLILGVGAFTVCYFTVDAVRERVNDIVSYSTAEYASIVLEEQETIVPQDWEGLAYPHTVPEGYSIHQQLRMCESSSGSLYYRKEGKSQSDLHYVTGAYQGKIKLETGGAVGESYEILGMNAMLYISDTHKLLFMTDGKVYHKITTDLSIPDADVIKMAQSVA